MLLQRVLKPKMLFTDNYELSVNYEIFNLYNVTPEKSLKRTLYH
jgi:hypothetical protein